MGTKKGKKALPEAEKRDNLIWVRVNDLELLKIDELRSKGRMKAITRSDYIRSVCLSKIPSSIPEINREAWSSLSKLLSNVNQYQHAINSGRANEYPSEILNELKNEIQLLRNSLIGFEK
jgi:hypothetical protein